MQNLLAVLYGVVFGIANVIPGVSGGTMLVTFGCFDKVCGALSLNFKEIKKNIRFLVFFGIGAAAGILGFSFVITWLFANFPTATYLFFMGLILGSVPLIWRNATAKEKFRPSCVIPFVLALALVVGLAVLESNSAGEPYSVGISAENGVQTITVTNDSDRTVDDWFIELQNGKILEGAEVTGAEGYAKFPTLDKLKSLVGMKIPDYAPNALRGSGDAAVIEPHSSVSFTISGGEAFSAEDFKTQVGYAMDPGFFALLLIASFIAAVAMIIPGVSGSFMMVLIGTYSTVIAAIKNLDIIILIPVAIGVILGLIFGARLISWLMKKFRLIVFSAILGLVIGSLYAILPTDVGLNLETLAGVFTFLIGGGISLLVGKHTEVEA